MRVPTLLNQKSREMRVDMYDKERGQRGKRLKRSEEKLTKIMLSREMTFWLLEPIE